MEHQDGQAGRKPIGWPARTTAVRAGNTAVPAVMQRENERGRVVIGGRRTDDGDQCTLIVIHEVGDTWALYFHGARQLGVRLTRADAVTMAQVLPGGAR